MSCMRQGIIVMKQKRCSLLEPEFNRKIVSGKKMASGKNMVVFKMSIVYYNL